MKNDITELTNYSGITIIQLQEFINNIQDKNNKIFINNVRQEHIRPVQFIYINDENDLIIEI